MTITRWRKVRAGKKRKDNIKGRKSTKEKKKSGKDNE